MDAIGTDAAGDWMKEGYMREQVKTAGAGKTRPEPDPFVFRAKHPNESKAEYEDLQSRAKARFMKLVDRNGRAKAVKGKLNDLRKEVNVEPSS